MSNFDNAKRRLTTVFLHNPYPKLCRPYQSTLIHLLGKLHRFGLVSPIIQLATFNGKK